MRVISTSGTRSINLVLRDYKTTNDGNYTVYLYNKNVGNTVEKLITGQTNSVIISNMNQISIQFTEDYLEGDEFNFYITGTGETKVLHRNKIYVTNQVTQNYSIDG